MKDLDRLALQAKTNKLAFEQLLQEMEGLCRAVACRYSQILEYDDLLQMARIEVWKAVLAYEGGKMPFFRFCRWSMTNHIKNYVRRQFGPKHALHRTTLRLSTPVGEEECGCLEHMLASPADEVEKILEKKELISELDELLSKKLSRTEYRCFVSFYYGGYKYEEILKKLKLKNGKSVDNALERCRNKLGKSRELFHLLSSIRA